ncbi:MAG: outer membrane beta-barrel protein [Xanthobacteraceae bacterium]
MARALAAWRSLAAINRAAFGATGFVLAFAVTFLPTPGLAQTTTATTDLLQPSLQGNPVTPPRFQQFGQVTPPGNQAPPTSAFVAPSRIGATPNYGSPTGLGEGDTGYDSMNTPKSKRKKRAAQRAAAGSQSTTTFAPVPNYALPPPLPPPLPLQTPLPEVYPKNAARRPGAIIAPPPEDLPINNPPAEVHPLSAANRPGAALTVPPIQYFDYSATTPAPTLLPLNTFAPGTLPQRPLPFASNDPFAPVGVRAGSFVLLPSVDLSGSYSTNPGHGSPTGPPSAYFVAAPELQVASDWERHALTADILGSYSEYASGSLVPSLNVPFLNSKIDGRIDVTRDTQILLENRFIVATDNPGSPNLQTELAKLPINQDVGGTLGLAQEINRLTFTLKGTIDRATYDPSLLTNGQYSTNADRNFDQYAAIMRVGYEIDPGMKPFLEVQEDQRIHDEEFDRNDLQRDSTGTSVKVGSVVDLFGTLTGEMAIGYLERRYQDPTLPNITGPIAAGTLIWQATALTTAKLTAASQVYETTVDNASGDFTHDINLEVDHAFRTWLIGILKLGYGTDDYAGSGLTDNRYFVSIGATYKFNREWWLRTELRQDWQTASQPGNSYTATSILLGLRWQR